MYKKICIILIFINITTLLCGCWGKKELAQISLVTALGIDKNEDKFVVTAQIINPIENSKYGGHSSPITTFTTEGITIHEALIKLSTKLPQKLYLAHLRILVFGERYGYTGIKECLDFFERHHEPRSDFFVVLAKNNTAQDILKVLTPIEKIPANKIYNSLFVSQKFWSASYAVTLFELIRNFQAPLKNGVLNTILVEGDNIQLGSYLSNITNSDPDVKIRIGYLAVLKNEKIVDFLTERESAAYNAIQGKIHNSVMSLQTSDGLVSYEVKRVIMKVIPYLNDNELRIKIRIDETGNISEVQSNINLTNKENIKKIEQIIAKESEAKLAELFDKAQNKLQCDFLKIYDVVHRKYPKIYKDHEEDWDNFFANIPIEYEVHSRINTFGIIKNATQ